MTPTTEQAHKRPPTYTPGLLLVVALTAAISSVLMLFVLARADRLNEKPAPAPAIVELEDVPVLLELKADDGARTVYRTRCDMRADAEGEPVGTMGLECRT